MTRHGPLAAVIGLILAAPLAAADLNDPSARLPGGAGTVQVAAGRGAFSQPAANLPFARQFDFRVGDGVFRRLWVSAPASTRASDGLGPLYNARSCQSCHLKDGRGRPPEPGEVASSLLLHLSIPPRTDAERAALAKGTLAAIPDPVYGGQLQTFAIQGHAAEGRVVVDWTETPHTLADGTVVSLRRPSWSVADPAYGPLAATVMISPRIAPPMIGLGLLEAIDPAEIRAGADPDDRDQDGLSGRVSEVVSQSLGGPALGRFGWKAQTATVADQTAGAFSGDMGLSTPLAPDPAGDCTAAQAACRAAPSGVDADAPAEVPPDMFDLVVFYARNLGVPGRGADSGAPQIRRGGEIFTAIGCAGCHRPRWTTATMPGRPEHSRQIIWPFTDLLLHDMGPDLADNRPVGGATGQEWRTPPLWGIGRTEAVSGHTQFLHDGRARSLLEAILWHGGEATAARTAAAALPTADRAALLAFLQSL